MNLESGAADAVCMDIGVANYEIEVRGDAFVMLEEQISTEQYGICFLLGNTDLRDSVQNTLLEMLDDGTYEEIAKKWGLEDCICLSHEEIEEAQKETSAVLDSEKSKEERKNEKENPQSPTSGIADEFIQNILDSYLKQH